MGSSQIENMLVSRYSSSPSISSSSSISGFEVAALWSNDDKHAYDLFQKSIDAKRAGDREQAILLSQYFDEQLIRRYDDKKSGTDPKLEPIQVCLRKNKVLKDGITRFNEILSDQSADFFYFYASGTGTTPVKVGQSGLATENARVDMRTNGVLDSFGNVLFMRARFATGIANATITEFGACDRPSDPSTFCWRVLLDTEEFFEHLQGETWYTGSHYLITYSK